LGLLRFENPALKRWAIFIRPYGPSCTPFASVPLVQAWPQPAAQGPVDLVQAGGKNAARNFKFHIGDWKYTLFFPRSYKFCPRPFVPDSCMLPLDGLDAGRQLILYSDRNHGRYMLGIGVERSKHFLVTRKGLKMK